MRSVVILTDVIFKILYNEMCQYLEDLQKPVNQYFPNDQYMMSQNHEWIKDSFKPPRQTNGFYHR